MLKLYFALLEQYLLHPELLPIHDMGPAQQHWRRTPDPGSILHTEVQENILQKTRKKNRRFKQKMIILIFLSIFIISHCTIFNPTEVCGRQHAITVVRDPYTGEVRDFVEQRLAMEDTGTHARNSSSMKRALAPPDSSFRGSAANYPFWPGGLDLPDIVAEQGDDELELSPDKLLHCPPGIQMI